jgi:hypothetical protein
MTREHVRPPVNVKGKGTLDKLLFNFLLKRSGDSAIPVDYVEDCDVEVPDYQGYRIPLKDDSLFKFRSVH